MIRRQLCCLFQHLLRWLFSAGLQNHVGTRDVLGVQPDVIFVGGFQSQLVVLAVIPSHQNPCSVRCCILHGRQRLGRFALAPQQAQITLLRQLRTQLFQIVLIFRTAQRIQHAVQIHQFLPSLGNLLRQDLLRRACFLIRLIIALGVLRRRQTDIQRNVYCGTLRLVEVLQNGFCVALVQTVEVGGDQVCLSAVVILFRTRLQICRLGGDPALNPLGGVEQQVEQIIGTLFQACSVVTAGEKFVQQRTGGGHGLGYHQCAVLVQRQE